MSNDKNHVAWITKQVKATLSHYPQDWNQSDDVRDVAIDHWIDSLAPFSRRAIEDALASHLRSQPRVKPTPGDIRNRARTMQLGEVSEGGDWASLNVDERFTLENKLIPGFQEWLRKFAPGSPMHAHAEKFLDHWGALEAAE